MFFELRKPQTNCDISFWCSVALLRLKIFMFKIPVWFFLIRTVSKFNECWSRFDLCTRSRFTSAILFCTLLIDPLWNVFSVCHNYDFHMFMKIKDKSTDLYQFIVTIVTSNFVCFYLFSFIYFSFIILNGTL